MLAVVAVSVGDAQVIQGGLFVSVGSCLIMNRGESCIIKMNEIC